MAATEHEGTKGGRGGEELPVITRAFDLAREMTQRTRKLPRDLKFVLGDRMLSTTYDAFDALLEAKYTRAKRIHLQRANLLLERLRFQIRLCMEEELISIRQYEFIVGLVNEVGSMTGGWLKAARE